MNERRMYAAERPSVRYHVRDDAQAGPGERGLPFVRRAGPRDDHQIVRELTQHGMLSLEDREAVDVERALVDAVHPAGATANQDRGAYRSRWPHRWEVWLGRHGRG
jgi:hypothetical protein